ncbi:MAG: hypothetical protein IJU23_11000 [Proteobacteria bacterium]|nr:hypothetical protein [Pseudomonadota bacterium]
MDAVDFDGDLTKQPGVTVVHVGGEPRRPKKKPVCLSFNEAQLAHVDERAAQSGENRSGQIERDLTAYWRLLADGFRRVQRVLGLDDARYIARIFKGRVLVASDDVLWCDELLCAYVRQSRTYGEAALAESVAAKINACDHFARLALMDWIRRAAVSKDAVLFEGWG